MEKTKGSVYGSHKQYLSDSVKAAKRNGSAWIQNRGRRYRICPYPKIVMGLPDWQLDTSAFCLVKGKGKIRFATLVEKDGLKAFCGSKSFHIHLKSIIAVIVEAPDGVPDSHGTVQLPQNGTTPTNKIPILVGSK